MGRAARVRHHQRCQTIDGVPMPHVDDLSRSLTAFDQDSTLVAVIDSWQHNAHRNRGKFPGGGGVRVCKV